MSNSLIQELKDPHPSHSPPHIFIKSKNASKCIVCKKLNPKYTCPKCKQPYCSIEHYRTHSLFCSQKFYEDQVNQRLKQTKVVDKKEKKKAIELMQQYYTSLQEEECMMNDQILSEQILEQWLKELEEGKEIKLSPLQEELFIIYLDKLMKSEDKQTIEFECEKQFWEIEDGLSLFWLQNPQIEEYNDTQHPDIICYRHLMHKRIKQLNLQYQEQKMLTKNIPLPHILDHNTKVIYCQTLSMAYLNVLLLRVHDGDYQESFKPYLMVFGSDIYQNLLLNPPQLDQSSIKYPEYVDSLLLIIKSFLVKNQGQGRVVIKFWLQEQKAQQILREDMKKIIDNRYLILQALFRLLDEAMKYQKSKLDSKQKSSRTKLIKMIKKLEYIIKVFVGGKAAHEGYDQFRNIWTHFISYRATIQRQESTSKQYTKALQKNDRRQKTTKILIQEILPMEKVETSR